MEQGVNGQIFKGAGAGGPPVQNLKKEGIYQDFNVGQYFYVGIFNNTIFNNTKT